MKATPETLHDFLEHTITTETLTDYLTAEWGYDLAVWQDGTIATVQSNVGYHTDEEPIIRIQCPGIGNLDSTRFTEDFCDERNEDGEYVENGTGRVIGDLADVIRECCRDGDVSSDLEQLIRDLETAHEAAAAEAAQFKE